jgi:hypothetical protein
MFVPPPIEQVKAMKDKRFVFAFCQCFLPCDNFTSSNTNKLERERESLVMVHCALLDTIPGAMLHSLGYIFNSPTSFLSKQVGFFF